MKGIHWAAFGVGVAVGYFAVPFLIGLIGRAKG